MCACTKLLEYYCVGSSHTHDQAWGLLRQNLPKVEQKISVKAQVMPDEMKFQIFHSNNLRTQEYVA